MVVRYMAVDYMVTDYMVTDYMVVDFDMAVNNLLVLLNILISHILSVVDI